MTLKKKRTLHIFFQKGKKAEIRQRHLRVLKSHTFGACYYHSNLLGLLLLHGWTARASHVDQASQIRLNQNTCVSIISMESIQWMCARFLFRETMNTAATICSVYVGVLNLKCITEIFFNPLEQKECVALFAPLMENPLWDASIIHLDKYNTK